MRQTTRLALGGTIMLALAGQAAAQEGRPASYLQGAIGLGSGSGDTTSAILSAAYGRQVGPALAVEGEILSLGLGNIGEGSDDGDAISGMLNAVFRGGQRWIQPYAGAGIGIAAVNYSDDSLATENIDDETAIALQAKAGIGIGTFENQNVLLEVRHWTAPGLDSDVSATTLLLGYRVSF